MNRAVLAALLLATAACGDRRSFDDRYRDTGRELENKARELDGNLSASEPANETASTDQPDR